MYRTYLFVALVYIVEMTFSDSIYPSSAPDHFSPSILTRLLLRLLIEDVCRVAVQVLQRLLARIRWGRIRRCLALLVGV